MAIAATLGNGHVMYGPGLLCSRNQSVDRNTFYLKLPSTSDILRNFIKENVWLDINDINQEGAYVNSDGTEAKFLE